MEIIILSGVWSSHSWPIDFPFVNKSSLSVCWIFLAETLSTLLQASGKSCNEIFPYWKVFVLIWSHWKCILLFLFQFFGFFNVIGEYGSVQMWNSIVIVRMCKELEMSTEFYLTNLKLPSSVFRKVSTAVHKAIERKRIHIWVTEWHQLLPFDVINKPFDFMLKARLRNQ